MTSKRFDAALLSAFAEAKSAGVRAGADHRYTAVWVVVVERRVFVRSWNDAPGGWFHAFREQPKGSVRLGKREIDVLGRVLRGPLIRKAVSRAYARKYDAKGAQKWVHGFAEPGREQNTLEILPMAQHAR